MRNHPVPKVHSKHNSTKAETAGSVQYNRSEMNNKSAKKQLNFIPSSSTSGMEW